MVFIRNCTGLFAMAGFLLPVTGANLFYYIRELVSFFQRRIAILKWGETYGRLFAKPFPYNISAC
jgi:hypothetical protein